MNINHATIWLDRTKAKVLHFEDQRFPVRRFRKTIELRSPEGAAGDVADRFFHDVCNALDDIPQVLLTGTAPAIAEFERYLATRAPKVARRIVGVQSFDKPTNRRLSVLACWHFKKPSDRRVEAN